MLRATFNLPKGYLSPSQITKWKSSKEAYRREYYEGEKLVLNSPEVLFGKKFADRLESGIPTDDPTMELIAHIIDKEEVMEYELTYYTPKGVKVYGKLDSARSDLSRVLEYKTSKLKWSQSKVDNLLQTRVYGAGVYLLTKKIPNVTLIHAETQKINNEVSFTGTPPTPYHANIGTVEILDTIRLIEKVAREISDDYTNYQNNLIH